MSTKKAKPVEAELEITENVVAETPKGNAKIDYIKAGKHSRIYFEGEKYLDRFVPGKEFSIAEVEAMTSEKEVM